MAEAALRGESRTFEQIKEHYLIERELSEKLRRASREERMSLYQEAYNELFRRVPHHPQLTKKAGLGEREKEVSSEMSYVKRFIRSGDNFVEIGPGDCKLSFEVSKVARQVYAVDVSSEITKAENKPKNFRLIISDGTGIPLPDNSVNIAYSNQLMEHLHPEDAELQLKNIVRVLKPGGVYLCFTPSSLSGPHDVSFYFDDYATGFHLKEYTIGELIKLFKEVGFRKIRLFIKVKFIKFLIPVFPALLLEKLLLMLPRHMARGISRAVPAKYIVGSIKVAAWK